MSGRHLAIWICNAVVAVLSILSILCYFFGPFWQFTAKISITETMLEEALQDVDTGEMEIDPKEIMEDTFGEGKTFDIRISFEIGTDDILSSIAGDSTAMVEGLIDKNVTMIIEGLRPDLMRLAKGVVKYAAKQTINDQVKTHMSNFLQKDENDSEVLQKMEQLGIMDEIDGQMDVIIDKIFDPDATVDSVTDSIMDSLDVVYESIRDKAADLSETDDSYDILQDIQPNDADIENIRESVSSMLEQVATGEDGKINADQLLDNLLSQLLSSANESGEVAPAEDVAAVSRLAADGETGDSTSPEDPDVNETAESLEEQIRDLIMGYLPEDTYAYFSYAFMAMAGLMFLSMLSWLYILIKLIVKLVKKAPNPTVKLKAPIWLGWLPYFLFVALPGIALMLLPMILPSFDVPAEAMSVLNSVRLSVSSISIIAMISAVVCFGISIFYMVMRKKFKKEGIK